LWWEIADKELTDLRLGPGESHYAVLKAPCLNTSGVQDVTIEVLTDSLVQPTIRHFTVDAVEGGYPEIVWPSADEC